MFLSFLSTLAAISFDNLPSEFSDFVTGLEIVLVYGVRCNTFCSVFFINWITLNLGPAVAP